MVEKDSMTEKVPESCRSDNRIENLKLMSCSGHNSHLAVKDIQVELLAQTRKIQAQEAIIKGLGLRVAKLETENALLSAEVRDNATPHDLNRDSNLKRYNTPTEEGIVQPPSNEGENDHSG